MPLVAATLASATVPVGAAGRTQTGVSAQLLHVGVEREYATLHAAMAAASDASAQRPYLILVDPGVYDLASAGHALQMRSHVSIAGLARPSTVLLTADGSNIRAASQSAIQGLTIRHQSSSGTEAIQLSERDLADFLLQDVTIDVAGNGAAIASNRWVVRCEVRDVTIITDAVGLAVKSGGFWYLHDVNIHLTGAGGHHLGISANSYCRIFVFGGKIGTGYGYPAVSDPTQPVIGVLMQAGFSGRVVMHGVWSICRNDGAPVGVAVSCVYATGPNGWARLFGGYFQAENPSGTGGRETLANPGGGKIEVYGTRCRDYGAGAAVYSTNQVGRRLYTVADHGLRLEPDMGGLCALDASGGSFTLELPPLPGEGAQFIFKKIDSSAHAVIIDAGGRRIDGAKTVALDLPYALLHLRYAFGQFLVVG